MHIVCMNLWICMNHESPVFSALSRPRASPQIHKPPSSAVKATLPERKKDHESTWIHELQNTQHSVQRRFSADTCGDKSIQKALKCQMPEMPVDTLVKISIRINPSKKSCQEKHGQLPSESLAELVVQRATANPSAFAMIGPEGTCTYGEILRRAELLASYLCESLEMASTSSASLNLRDLENLLEESILHMDEDKSDNPLIGLMVAPGPWMLAGPLGAWMSGRGYFALDAAHPLERIQQMTQDAAPQCVFTERKNQSLANSLGWPAFFVEDLTLQRLLYCICVRVSLVVSLVFSCWICWRSQCMARPSTWQCIAHQHVHNFMIFYAEIVVHVSECVGLILACFVKTNSTRLVEQSHQTCARSPQDLENVSRI